MGPVQTTPGRGPALCGAGLLWSWSYLFFFVNQGGEQGALMSDLVYLAFALLASVAVLALGVRVRTTSQSLTVLATAGCALLVAGTAGSVFLSAPAASMAARAACGLGQGLFWIAWASLLARTEIGRVESSVLAWTPILAATALVTSALWALPDERVFFGAFFLLLPIGSLVAFWAALRASDEAPAAVEGVAFGMGDARTRGASVTGAPTLVDWMRSEGLAARLASLACATGALSVAMGTFGTQMSVGFSRQLLMFALAAVVTCAVAWVAMRNTRRYDLSTLYRWSLPAVVVAICTFIVTGDTARTMALLLLTVASVSFELMAKLYVVHMAARSGIDTTVAAASALAMPALGSLVPVVVWVALGRDVMADALPSLLAAIVLFSFAVVLSMGHDSEPARDLREQVMGTGGPYSADTGGAQARLAELAADAGLSPRETEVLAHLAKGHSRAYIREAMYLSKGTVDTHVNHIYKKLGVSSRDELMRLVESQGG